MTHDEPGWERGWDGHEQAQRLRMARLPLTEKLQWLEDAHRIVLHMRRFASVRRPARPKDPGP